MSDRAANPEATRPAPGSVSNQPLSRRSPDLLDLRIWPMLAIGALLQLLRYGNGRSLWLDEALLALNVLHRSFAGLARPLDFHQGAPLGFLLLQKLATSIGGKSELALRSVPLLAGLLSLALFWQVARIYLSGSAVPLAVALFALNPGVVHYASEAKQYSTDIAVTLVLLWAAAEFSASTPNARSSTKFGLLGAVAIWFSHPAVFVLAGIAVTFLTRTLIERDWNLLRRFFPVATGWGGNFAMCYFVLLRPLGSDPALLAYWRGSFPLHPIGSLQNAGWIVDNFFGMFNDPAVLWAYSGVALFAAGCVGLMRRSRTNFSLLITPLAFTLLAALLHRYPFGGRLLLFLIPILLMMIAEGVIWVLGRCGKFSVAAGAVLILALLAKPVLADVREAIHPQRPEDFGRVIRFVQAHQHAGDVWFIYHFARYQYWYYAELYGLSPSAVRIGRDCGADAACYAADLDQLRGDRRVWVLFSHVWVGDGLQEEDFAIQHLDHMGTIEDRFSATGARAYLYDLRQGGERSLP